MYCRYKNHKKLTTIVYMNTSVFNFENMNSVGRLGINSCRPQTLDMHLNNFEINNYTLQ